MENIDGWLIAFGVLGLHNYLSRRKSVYWGAFIPVAYLLFLIVLFAQNWNKGMTSLILPAIVGLFVLGVNWAIGRDAVKKKASKKVRIQDS